MTFRVSSNGKSSQMRCVLFRFVFHCFVLFGCFYFLWLVFCLCVGCGAFCFPWGECLGLGGFEPQPDLVLTSFLTSVETGTAIPKCMSERREERGERREERGERREERGERREERGERREERGERREERGERREERGERREERGERREERGERREERGERREERGERREERGERREERGERREERGERREERGERREERGERREERNCSSDVGGPLIQQLCHWVGLPLLWLT